MDDSTKRILTGLGIIVEVGGEVAYTPKGKNLKLKIENTIRKYFGIIDAQEVELPLFIDYLTLKIDKSVLLGRHLTCFKINSKNDTNYLLARTSEELAANYFFKHKEDRLIYQIKDKFRNENPKELNVLKRKEFTMMDAYSFDRDIKKMEESYQKIKQCFCQIFSDLGIDYRIQKSKEKGPPSEEFISKIKKIEIGHIFHLDNLYTKPYGMGNILMGSYGLGIDRIMVVVLLSKKDFEKINLPDIEEGVGIDIEDVSYFEKRFYTKNKEFYHKIFTPKEISYCLSKTNPYPSFTARFCAKEAFIKATKIPVKDLREIEINFDGEKPIIQYRDVRASLSISHTNDRAIAIVSLKSHKKYVFLPGLGINSTFIGKLKKELEEDIYYFDLPGHGYKPIDRKKTISIQKIKRLLEKELIENHIERPILIGYSYGGFVALDYALKNPVEKLILINTSPETVIRPNHLGILRKQFKSKFNGENADFTTLKYKNDSELSDAIFKSMPIETFSVYWKSVFKYNLTKKLDQLSCPLLIIAGKNDLTISKTNTEKFRIVTDNIHYLEGGHYLPLTNPKKVSEIILNQEVSQ